MKFKEWVADDRAYNREATVRERDFREQSKSDVDKFESIYGLASTVLTKSIGKRRSITKTMDRRTKKSGRLNTRYVGDELKRLHSGKNLTERVYDTRVNPEREMLKINSAVGILMDQSGSTRFNVENDLTRIDLIKYASLLAGRSMDTLDDSFFVYSFHTHHDADPTYIENLKELDEPWSGTIEERIGAIRHTADGNEFNNKDGAAIRYANQKLLSMPQRTRYLFMVTDGFPNCDYTYYKGNTAFQDTRMAMKEGFDNGINYVYLTINPDNCSTFMDTISDVSFFRRQFKRMSDVVEGLTLAYEKIKRM